jgi:hypothetical protein
MPGIGTRLEVRFTERLHKINRKANESRTGFDTEKVN